MPPRAAGYRRMAVLVGGALLAGVAPSGAQSATVGVAASISTTALTLAQVADLRFGNIVPGVPLTVNPRTSASAGQFQVNGNRNAEIQVTFTLPTVLRAGSGPLTVPVAFSNASACGGNKVNQAGCSTFDPAVPFLDRIRNKVVPDNTYFVWIGGTVSPSPTQAPAVYYGTITMSVAYTGN